MRLGGSACRMRPGGVKAPRQRGASGREYDNELHVAGRQRWPTLLAPVASTHMYDCWAQGLGAEGAGTRDAVLLYVSIGRRAMQARGGDVGLAYRRKQV